MENARAKVIKVKKRKLEFWFKFIEPLGSQNLLKSASTLDIVAKIIKMLSITDSQILRT
jgi:hypothetical protein